MRKLRLLLSIAFATTAFSACQSSLVAPDDPPPPPVDCEEGYEWSWSEGACTKPTSGS